MKTMREINEEIEKTKWWKATKIEGLPITWGILGGAMLVLLVAGWWIMG
jgi:hypothetical protein